MKNRIAAQTARDRKKERMDHLEEAIARLESENLDLCAKNEELRTQSSDLLNENTALKSRLESTNNTSTHNNTNCNTSSRDEESSVSPSLVSECKESAALAVPQQKGRTQVLLAVLLYSSIILNK